MDICPESLTYLEHASRGTKKQPPLLPWRCVFTRGSSETVITSIGENYMGRERK